MTPPPRASFRPPNPAAVAARVADEVRYYLTQEPKQLPSRLLYDALGSALFQAIGHLPWYRVTRAESALLSRHAAAILRSTPPTTAIVELGSGNGAKLALLLAGRPAGQPAPDVHLVDVSKAALEVASRAAGAAGAAGVVAHQTTYEAGIEDALREIGGRRGRTLALFLGSNIGNFDPPSGDALLRHVAGCLRRGDAILLGADLVKPERDLRLAYDDPLGVTAAFNLNLLVRINRELGADFDLAGFRHRATWNAAQRRMEMHLESTRAQRVRVPGADLEIVLAAGETIWTESSYKYVPGDVDRMLARAGFAPRAHWVDEEAGFALALAGVPGGP